MFDNITEIGGKLHRFPTTRWTLLEAIRDQSIEIHNEIINFLLTRYWKPVYYFLRQQGSNNEDAKDLVQEFFTSCIERNFFAQADPSRGRFRNLLLSSLKNFLRNVHRAEHTKRRQPPDGIVSIEEVITNEELSFEPADSETPEDVFNREWAKELVLRILKLFENECRATGKEKHYKLLKIRVIAPAIEGAKAPPLNQLVEDLGLTEKQASNFLITARRGYQRLLREEIRRYAVSDEDIAAEVQDLFDFLSDR